MKTCKKILAVLLAAALLLSLSTIALAADYKLIYDANGGINAPSSQTYTKAGMRTISSTKPKREGYRFCGWSTTPDDDSEYGQYFPGDQIYVDSVITLYAVWGCPHSKKFEVGLRDYDANYFVSTQYKDAFLDQFGVTIDQYYAGCRFYYCPDCVSLRAIKSNGDEVSVKTGALMLAGPGFFSAFPLYDTNEKYSFIPLKDSDALADGEYWFDMEAFCLDIFGCSYEARRNIVLSTPASDGAVDWVPVLNESRTFVLLLVKYHRNVGGTYRDYYAFTQEMDMVGQSLYTGKCYLRQHVASAQPDTPAQTAENVCKWCGETHSGSFIQTIIGFIHSILAMILGAKY